MKEPNNTNSPIISAVILSSILQNHTIITKNLGDHQREEKELPPQRQLLKKPLLLILLLQLPNQTYQKSIQQANP